MAASQKRYQTVRPAEPLSRRVPYWVHRIVILAAGMMIFFSPLNPGRVSELINENASLFTTALSYDTITNTMARPLKQGWILESDIRALMLACGLIVAGILLSAVGGCMSVGNVRMKKRGVFFPIGGSLLMAFGLYRVRITAEHVAALAQETDKVSRVKPMEPAGWTVFAVMAGLILATSLILLAMSASRKSEQKH